MVLEEGPFIGAICGEQPFLTIAFSPSPTRLLVSFDALVISTVESPVLTRSIPAVASLCRGSISLGNVLTVPLGNFATPAMIRASTSQSDSELVDLPFSFYIQRCLANTPLLRVIDLY